jgi:ABC-2 type transport system ATP-binding protein
MQEVQALCDRVVVINKGEIVADSSLESFLSVNADTVVLVAAFGSDIPINLLQDLAGVTGVERTGTATYRISAKAGTDLRPEIFRLAADKNLSLIGLKVEEHSLEHVFQSLTRTEGVEH